MFTAIAAAADKAYEAGASVVAFAHPWMAPEVKLASEGRRPLDSAHVALSLPMAGYLLILFGGFAAGSSMILMPIRAISGNAPTCGLSRKPAMTTQRAGSTADAASGLIARETGV